MNKYQDYQPVQFSWIGDIPSHWKIGKVKQGFDRKKEPSEEKDPVVLSLARSGVRIRDISNNEGQLAESYEGYNTVVPGDLLLNPMDLYSGANCSISRVSGVISPAYINLRAKEGFDALFYDYYFKYQYWAMAFFAHGKGVSFDNRWTLSMETLNNYPIVIPPYDEQVRIAKYLDETCFDIDNAIMEAKKSIEKYKQLKRSMASKAALSGYPTKHGSMKDSGELWLGEIPANWDVRRIANLYEESKETGRDDLPILMVSINTGISKEEVGDDDRIRKVVRSEDRSSYKIVRPNYLAYNMMRAWQGGFGAAQVEGMVSPAYVVARPKVDVDTRYIEAVLRTPNAMEQIRGLSYGVTDFRRRLYWQYFKNMKVCFPPIIEQIQIANHIEEESKKIDSLVAEQEAIIEKMDHYRRAIVFEAVTGKRKVV